MSDKVLGFNLFKLFIMGEFFVCSCLIRLDAVLTGDVFFIVSLLSISLVFLLFLASSLFVAASGSSSGLFLFLLCFTLVVLLGPKSSTVIMTSLLSLFLVSSCQVLFLFLLTGVIVELVIGWDEVFLFLLVVPRLTHPLIGLVPRLTVSLIGLVLLGIGWDEVLFLLVVPRLTQPLIGLVPRLTVALIAKVWEGVSLFWLTLAVMGLLAWRAWPGLHLSDKISGWVCLIWLT